MGGTTGVEKLQNDTAAFRVHRVGNAVVAFDLVIRVNARSAELTAAGARDCRRFNDDQATCRGALGIMFNHHVAWAFVWIGAQPGEWGHNHTMIERDGAEVKGAK
jgi:hypothetical protein